MLLNYSFVLTFFAQVPIGRLLDLPNLSLHHSTSIWQVLFPISTQKVEYVWLKFFVGVTDGDDGVVRLEPKSTYTENCKGGLGRAISLAIRLASGGARLRRMGCVGDVIVAGGIDALNNSDTVFVADFLRELFGNIARYADSTQRYVVLVSAAQDRVTIDVTDRPRQGDATFEGAAFRACVLSGACAACARGLGCAGETRAVGTACFSAGR